MRCRSSAADLNWTPSITPVVGSVERIASRVSILRPSSPRRSASGVISHRQSCWLGSRSRDRALTRSSGEHPNWAGVSMKRSSIVLLPSGRAAEYLGSYPSARYCDGRGSTPAFDERSLRVCCMCRRTLTSPRKAVMPKPRPSRHCGRSSRAASFVQSIPQWMSTFGVRFESGSELRRNC